MSTNDQRLQRIEAALKRIERFLVAKDTGAQVHAPAPVAAELGLIHPSLVIDTVAAVYLFTPDDIVGRVRTAHLVWARQVAITIALELGRWTPAEIARAFGRVVKTLDYTAMAVRIRAETDRAAMESLNRCRKAVELAIQKARPTYLETLDRPVLNITPHHD